TGLWRVPASGGGPPAGARPGAAKGERAQRWAAPLPDGKGILLTGGDFHDVTLDEARPGAPLPTNREGRRVGEGGSGPRYVATGHLLYTRAGAVQAAPFSKERLELTGPPVTALDRVVTYPANGGAQFAVSEAGSLAYIPGGALAYERSLVWVDR